MSRYAHRRRRVEQDELEIDDYPLLEHAVVREREYPGWVGIL